MKGLNKGDILGRYIIQESIGEGGMGIVYSAEPCAGGPHVAIKTLKPELYSNPTARVRFIHEAETLKQLRSPHTVKVFELSQERKVPYYTMELLEGESLSSMITRDGKLPGNKIIHYVKQILLSLTEAHILGIIHRDLSPSNVHLCSIEGQPIAVKVLDFGLAKSLAKSGRSKRVTNSGMTLGTLRYMAPEQLKLQPLSPGTDLYAIGHVIFEMLTGSCIYEGMSNGEVIDHKIQGQLPHRFEATMNHPLGAVIAKALSHDPSQRYTSAPQMYHHISHLERDYPVSSNLERPPDSSPPDVRQIDQTKEWPISPMSPDQLRKPRARRADTGS